MLLYVRGYVYICTRAIGCGRNGVTSGGTRSLAVNVWQIAPILLTQAKGARNVASINSNNVAVELNGQDAVRIKCRSKCEGHVENKGPVQADKRFRFRRNDSGRQVSEMARGKWIYYHIHIFMHLFPQFRKCLDT